MRVEMRGRYEVRGYKLRLALLLLFKIFRFLSIIKLTWRIWNAGKTNRLFQIQGRNLLRIRGQLTRSHHRSRVLCRFLLYVRSPFFSILPTQVYTNGFGHAVRKLQVLNSNEKLQKAFNRKVLLCQRDHTCIHSSKLQRINLTSPRNNKRSCRTYKIQQLLCIFSYGTSLI